MVSAELGGCSLIYLSAVFLPAQYPVASRSLLKELVPSSSLFNDVGGGNP